MGLLGDGNLYLVLTCLIAKTLYEAIACAIISGMFPRNHRLPTLHETRMILSLGLPAAMLGFLITCNYNIDVVLLNAFKSGEAQVGIFGVAYSLSNMIWFVPDAFKEYIYNKSSKNSYSRSTAALVIINMALCAAICIGFALFGRELLALLYGREYVIAYETILIVFIGIVPMVAFKLIHPIYVNSGHSLRVALLLIASILINLLISIYTVPLYGALGAAIATVGAYSLCGLAFWLIFTRDYRINLSDIKNEITHIFRSLFASN